MNKSLVKTVNSISDLMFAMKGIQRVSDDFDDLIR
jgi:hypothetical protein